MLYVGYKEISQHASRVLAASVLEGQHAVAETDKTQHGCVLKRAKERVRDCPGAWCVIPLH